MNSLKSPTDGSSTLGPILGKLADSRGPRPSLALSFVLLLSGYLGMKAVYDSWEGNTKPAGGGTLFTLILCAALFGIGSEAGFCAALNVVMKSFPDRIVSRTFGSATHTLNLDPEIYCDWKRDFWPRIVGVCFFHDCAHNIPRQYFGFLACFSTRHTNSNGTWLVPDSYLPIP